MLVLLSGVILLCGCRQNVAPPPQTLNEFSTEQLRTVLRGYSGDWRGDVDRSRGLPAPPVQQPIPEGAAIIDLVPPDALTVGELPLSQLVRQRRSLREYAATPLTNEELSFLLWCTQGVSCVEQDQDGSISKQFRNVPSGGGRNPFETYLIVNRVVGLEPGLYRFLPFGHKLCLLRQADDLPEQVQAVCYGQPFVRDAAVVFVWSAIPYRTEWKYGYIAHRMIAIEAGHLCQSLYLASEAINAGTCALLGYSQTHMDSLIGVDGQDEFTIYMASVGKKVAGE